MRTDWNRVKNSVCQVCGVGFYRSPKSIEKNRTCCCSRECSAELRKEWMKGAGNHQYGLKGSLNSSFKNDWRISTYGYILVRSLHHPLRMYNNFVFLHRLLLEEYLKREDPGSDLLIEVDGIQVLSPEIDVHHIDGNRFNNSIDNLEVMTRGDHSSLHNKDSIIERNEDGTFKSVRPRKKSGRVERRHITDAGSDIYSSETVRVYPGKPTVISTNFSASIPDGYCGIVWSRSGLSVKKGLEVGAGLIDSSYRGEIKVVMYNHSEEPAMINEGDRIAQIIVLKVSLDDFEEVHEIEQTARGSKGFGSSGI